jgi:hypothetical protein
MSSVPQLVAVTPSVLDTIDAVLVGNHVRIRRQIMDGVLTPTLVRKIQIFYYQPALKLGLTGWSCDEQPKSSTKEGT